MTHSDVAHFADGAEQSDNIMDVPIGGLGILMAKKNADEISYERTDGSNVAKLVKRW